MVQKVLTTYNQLIKTDNRYKNIPKGMMTRLAVSILKYAMAISATNMAINVREEHINKAVEFIEEKLNCLPTINPDDVSDNNIQSGMLPSKKRQNFIVGRFKGQVVTPAELHNLLNRMSLIQ